MPAKPKHKDAIVQAAVTLFRRQGYCATGLNEIVELSGAPKGSLYYYFPAGKASIAEAAVRLSAGNVSETLRRLGEEHATPGGLVRAFAEAIGGWMRQSGFRSGSPITTVLLETTPDDPAVTAAGREAFASWRETIATRLVEYGASRDRAARLAGFAVSAMEGALIQARVEGDATMIETAGEELEVLLNVAAPGPASPQGADGPAKDNSGRTLAS